MNATMQPISVTAPVSPAFARVRTVLFAPFDLGRWLAIAFCAWLACLGEAGGLGGGLNYRFGSDHHNYERSFAQARDWVMDNLYWLAPVVVAGLIVGVVLWVVFLWLSSRGWFMFFQCVAENRAEVVAPWTRFAPHANSLFLFRVLLSVASGLTVTVPILLAGLIVVLLAHSGGAVFGVVGLALAILVGCAVAIFWAVVTKFTYDFVVPFMARFTSSVWDGWEMVLKLIRPHAGVFVLYVLFQIVIKLAILALVVAATLATCCCGGILLALPFIGTALMLPVLVFERAYSLCFLRQFGAEFDFFAPPPAAPEIV